MQPDEMQLSQKKVHKIRNNTNNNYNNSNNNNFLN